MLSKESPIYLYCIYLNDRTTERTGQRDLLWWFHSSNGCNSQIWATLKQGTPSWFSPWVTEAQVPQPSSRAFPGTLARNWVRNRTARTRTGTLIWGAGTVSATGVQQQQQSPDHRILVGDPREWVTHLPIFYTIKVSWWSFLQVFSSETCVQ